MKRIPRKFHLLLVDDEPNITASLRRVFLDREYEIRCAGSGGEALELMRGTPVDCALVDLKMPGMDGMATLKAIRESHPDTRVIILTGHGGVREAIEAIRAGAVDFVEKPFSAEALRARVSQIFQIWTLEAENRRLASRAAAFRFRRLVGHSPAIMKLKETIAQTGPSDASILILGETGTGKELVAHAIHQHSPRADKPFVPVDCAAISETVIESELFGHVKGAFTGAGANALGLIRSADGGTLFLDEVGELPLAIQAKLLRTIQEREVRPVGDTRSHFVDTRILAATNRDLETEVAEGRFREDLYYRLDVITLHVPPLREREGDLPLLIRHFIRKLESDLSPVTDISPEAVAALEAYAWPGNIRELENTIRRAVALGRDPLIRPTDLPDQIAASPAGGGDTGPPPGGSPAAHTLAAYEAAAIRNALNISGGNRKEAAAILEIGEATLYRKIKKYGISTDRPDAG